ncbi:MAG: potassium transporter Trk [Betaproteobacteria bacterium RIFCSPLOWO2_02_FULL_64_12]|nr:MAG: potassium transporter Trk [Betaproteobacteria bacterium RIFCSPLOWO2_02_FULL_64_12]
MVRLPAVLNLLSVVIVIFALCMLLPLVVAFFHDDGALHAYDESVLITLVAGAALWAATRKHRRELQTRDGFLLVALTWTVVPAFATLPLLLYLPGLSFTDAYFETVSGLTTTGATTLSGLDSLPPSINLWRMFLVWIGGMGVVVLAVAILPLLGVGGSQIFRAETPGPMKDTRLTPRITETAKGLWLVYGLITVLCVLALKAAGMGWFDALMQSFSTMGLGAFTAHDRSFAYFDSPAVEAVTIFFMLVAGINFGTHFLALRRASFEPYRHDPEAGVYLVVILLSVLGIAYFLFANQVYGSFWTALRYAAFNVVSIATTTGYSNTDYNQWPIFAPVWMLFLCCFASCSGSTGGGIKMVRAELMVRQALREMQRIIHPRALIPVKLGGIAVENNIIFAVLAFMLMYGGAIIAMTMVLAASGLDIVTAFTAVVACINNTGPGLARVGPATTYASLNDFQTWVLTFAMLLGRLQLFTLLVVLTPSFWRK